MIPRYRARLDLRPRASPLSIESVLSCAREWIGAIERSPAIALAPGSVRLPSGSELSVVQHAVDGRQLVAVRYDRTSPGSSWRAELGCTPTAEGVRAFIQIFSGVHDQVAPGGRGSAPRITKLLATTYAASAGIPLSASPLAVADQAGVDSLFSMLEEKSRRVSLVCIALEDDPGTPWLNAAVQLQTKLMGLAQVVVLGVDAASRLSQRIDAETSGREAGRVWGVTGGAVRLYWPGVDFEAGNPFRHRMWFPRTSELDRAALEEELFDTLAWASAQDDDPERIDAEVILRAIDRDALGEARLKALEDERFYEEYCRRLEADKERLEREGVALAEQRREANERADEAQRGRESLRYQYEQLAREAHPSRRSSTEVPQARDPDALAILRYCRGGRRDRDCIDELDLPAEARGHVEEHLAWLSSPASWARPAGRLEQVRDGVHEFRVNVKDHWLRLLVARLPTLRAVVVLHAFAKKSNELPQADVKVALDRLRELGPS
jgi:phage-related protein/nucleotide-binding universal stress UspA family protein